MTRAPHSLAPPWRVDRALRKLLHRNACSVCGAPFKPNAGTATGFDASGAALGISIEKYTFDGERGQ